MPVVVTGAQAVAQRYRQYAVQYAATVRTTLSREAEVTEQRLKQEAPWQDRTGYARAHLHAGVREDTTGQFALVAGHGAETYYGVFLEHAHQGRFAVLWPVLRTQWPRTLRRVAADVKRMKLA